MSMVLGIDVLARGLVQLFLFRPGADTAAAFACVFTLADALTQLERMPERDTLPYSAAAALALFCCMWGTYAKRQGLRLSCRTAASASTPYLVTLDPRSWNGRDTYAKWSGPIHGYGSQIQEEDGAQRSSVSPSPCFCWAAFSAPSLPRWGRERGSPALVPLRHADGLRILLRAAHFCPSLPDPGPAALLQRSRPGGLVRSG
ncbi:MAG: hypothetical protein ACLSAF_04790 [Intestinimonas sp.]